MTINLDPLYIAYGIFGLIVLYWLLLVALKMSIASEQVLLSTGKPKVLSPDPSDQLKLIALIIRHSKRTGASSRTVIILTIIRFIFVILMVAFALQFYIVATGRF